MADLTLESALGDPFYSSHLTDFSHRTKPRCKYCGKKGLRWCKINEKWFLYEKKSPHRCTKMPMSLDLLKKLADDGKLKNVVKRRKYVKHVVTQRKNGLNKLISKGIKTSELLDLFEDLIKENLNNSPNQFIQKIREEILKRSK